MARILVTAPATVSAGDAAERLVQQMRADGHEAIRLTDDATDPLETLRTTDAVVAILDGPVDEQTGAAMAYARAQHKPVLGLHGDATPSKLVRSLLADHHGGQTVDDWISALPGFYQRVTPFAGRLVRDLIPQLVKDAGHEIQFRALNDDEKPRFLKEKILEEARQLRNADAGAEKEEVADLLETLETLIRARGYDRDALRQVKEAKRKRRGGFDRCWVVEETASPPAAASEETAFTL